jgi:arginase
MHSRVFTLPYDSGHRGLRMGAGPEALLRRGLVAGVRAGGHDVEVEEIAAPEGFQTEVGTSFHLYRRLAERVRAARMESGAFPLTLAGNCGASIGALAGLRGLGAEDSCLIWFDAHGDFNTPETTRSGFLDGMALAIATGQCWRRLVEYIPGFAPIAPERVIHVGGRALDDGEMEHLELAGVCVVPAERVRREGLAAALTAALDAMSGVVRHAYLHLDLDALDPTEGQANGFAAPGGLTANELGEAVELVGARFAVCGITLSAYDPAYDGDERVAEVGVRLVMQLMSAMSRH